jgi:hypothetical protein
VTRSARGTRRQRRPSFIRIKRADGAGGGQRRTDRAVGASWADTADARRVNAEPVRRRRVATGQTIEPRVTQSARSRQAVAVAVGAGSAGDALLVLTETRGITIGTWTTWLGLTDTWKK